MFLILGYAGESSPELQKILMPNWVRISGDGISYRLSQVTLTHNQAWEPLAYSASLPIPHPHSISNMFIIWLILFTFLKFRCSHVFSGDLPCSGLCTPWYQLHAMLWRTWGIRIYAIEVSLIKHQKCHLLLICETTMTVIFNEVWGGASQPPGHMSKSSRPEVSDLFCKGHCSTYATRSNCTKDFWLCGHMGSVTATQLGHCGIASDSIIAIDSVNEHTCVAITLYK